VLRIKTTSLFEAPAPAFTTGLFGAPAPTPAATLFKNASDQIWVRRAGPNYQKGLRMMRDTAQSTGLPIHIYGPETHVTAIVPLALGLEKLEKFPEFDDPTHVHAPLSKKKQSSTISKDTNGSESGGDSIMSPPQPISCEKKAGVADHKVANFSASTRCVVYGLQNRAVQGMLDFDFMCKRQNHLSLR
jgi:ATP citrate (pro-S)-lyase